MPAAATASKARRNSTVRSNLSRSPKAYNSYNFIDKDPIIFEIERLIDETGTSFAHIERRSGVTPPTLKRWFSGKTKRPMHCTIRAVLRAIGYDYAIVKREPTDNTATVQIPQPPKGRHLAAVK